MRLHMNERSFLKHLFIRAWDENTTSFHEPLLRCGAGQREDSRISVYIDTVLHSRRHSFIGLWHNSSWANDDPLCPCALIDQARILVPLQHKLIMDAFQHIKGSWKEQLRTVDSPHDARLAILDKSVLQRLKERFGSSELNLLIGPWHIDGWPSQGFHRAVANVADSAVVLLLKHHLLCNKLNVFVGICEEERGPLHHTPCASAHMSDARIVSLL
mmetsp:Transcript_47411/g.110522  ORF Transcript_47411/g.110522 Transcript_47411/m.110522 type:complete len:215 (+) Transcript_47411:1026-1670(+)